MKKNIDTRKSKKSNKNRMAVSNAASKKEYKHNNPKKKKNALGGKFAKIIMIILFVVIAIVFVLTSGAFDIKEIIVEGNSFVSSEQIISFSGVQIGSNLFAISKKDTSAKIKENSYINDVIIKRCLPDKLKLIVEEREIEYALQLGNSYAYINSQGYILEISENYPGVPIILGYSTDISNIKANNRLEENDLNKINVVIKIMETARNNGMENLITKIDITNEQNYTIYLDSENKIAYLGDGNELNTRFLYIKKILSVQQGKTGEIFVNVDLNSEYVYFRESI